MTWPKLRRDLVEEARGRTPKGRLPISPAASARNKTGYLGVRRHADGAWECSLQVGGKRRYLGRFETPALAAQAYDEAARASLGARARLNFPRAGELPARPSDADSILTMVVEAASGCWEWAGRRSDAGYGRLTFRGHEDYAHRVSYLVFRGEIPNGLLVCHECDNPPCANPKHLFLGTELDNSRDAQRKGRLASGFSRASRGESHGCAKLTWADVREMRRLGAEGATNRVLREQFGVSKSQVARVLREESWKAGTTPCDACSGTGRASAGVTCRPCGGLGARVR